MEFKMSWEESLSLVRIQDLAERHQLIITVDGDKQSVSFKRANV